MPKKSAPRAQYQTNRHAEMPARNRGISGKGYDSFSTSLDEYRNTVLLQISCNQSPVFKALTAFRLGVSLLLLGVISAAQGQVVSTPVQVESFLQNHCIDCHDGSDGEGGFDVAQIADGLDATTMDRWVRVVDRVAAGEMPPKDSSSIEKDEQKAFLNAASKWLTDVQKQRVADEGRVPSRRMTNLQLERTLQDLLAIDVPLSRELPAEPRNSGFTGIASSQSISHFQLQQHLGVVDKALEAAFTRVLSAEDEVLNGWTKDLPADRIARNKK